jgi:hypothetical protein
MLTNPTALNPHITPAWLSSCCYNSICFPFWYWTLNPQEKSAHQEVKWMKLEEILIPTNNISHNLETQETWKSTAICLFQKLITPQ